MRTADRVRLVLRPSGIAAVCIAAGTLATAALVAWLPIDASLRSLVVIGVGAQGLCTLRRAAALSLDSSVVGAELAPDRSITLARRDGRTIVGQAQADSYVGTS